MPAITTDNLHKSFDGVTALENLSLTVAEGELFGFIGPNGAGKTTTVNLLTGQLSPDSGSMEVLGIDPVAQPVEVRRRVGILPERESPPSFMTPREYFRFVADIRDIPDVADRIIEWSDRLKFTNQLDTLCMDLSKGEKQKVMITQAFLHDPALVFIDEPLINLDPIIQERVKRFLQEYNDEGNTVFLSTHVMHLAEELCDRVGILNQGLLIADREMDAVRSEGTLAEVFIREVERSGPAGTDD